MVLMSFEKQAHKLATCTILAALSIVPATLMASAAQADENNRPATIAITGEGKVSAEPDLAIFSFGVQERAKTARQALTANNEKMAKITEALKKQGIENRDLQTSNFSIRPVMQHFQSKNNKPPKPPIIVGYTVSNELSIRVRDLSKLGEIMDEAVTLGVNNGGNLRFGNDNPEELLQQARKKAVENAIAKATVLTETAGVKLGKIMNISENGFNRPRPIPMAKMAMTRAADAESVPVQAGENSYTISVSLQWEIEQ